MDYKGIYFGRSKSQKFFEFGAHFKYSDLYRQLEILGGKILDNENKPLIRNKSIDDNPNKIPFISEEKKILTRNNNKNIYLNHTHSLNFNKSLNISKIRKKSGLIHSSKNINYINNLIEPYQKIKNNIFSYIPLSNEKVKNNILCSNSIINRNKYKNLFIYQIKNDNKIPSLKTQNINSKKTNNNKKLNNPKKSKLGVADHRLTNNNIKHNNLINIHSRNKNLLISPIKSEERTNLLSNSKRKMFDYNNEILFSKTLNHKKFTLITQNFKKKSLNHYLTSSKNESKTLLSSNNINSERFGSVDDLFNKNLNILKSINKNYIKK